MSENDSLIDEFDMFPEAPSGPIINLPEAPSGPIINLPNAPKTDKGKIKEKIDSLLYKIYLKYIRTNCPKDKETIQLNTNLIQLVKNYNDSLGGSRKTKKQINKKQKTKNKRNKKQKTKRNRR
jgi:hypothetical protein